MKTPTRLPLATIFLAASLTGAAAAGGRSGFVELSCEHGSPIRDPPGLGAQAKNSSLSLTEGLASDQIVGDIGYVSAWKL
jgi:hypothetical protein